MKRANWIANAVLASGLALSSAAPMNVMAEENGNIVSQQSVLPTSITASTSSIQLSKGQSQSVGVTFSEGTTDTSVTWTSDNASIVTVTQDGTITAVGDSGSASVSVYSTNNPNVCTTITVSVVGNQPASEQTQPTSEEVQPASNLESQDTTVYPTSFSVYSSVSSKKLNQGETSFLTTNGFNANCTNTNVTWSSSDNKVATVASNGEVIAVGAGTVTITATSVGKNADMESPASASITFTVYGVDKQSGYNYSVNDNGITLEKYTGSDTEVTIPSTIDGKTVTSIGKNAFMFASNKTEITKVTIPDTVVSIGDYAFSGLTNLESVTIPTSVTSIGKRAFYNTALKSVSIPSGVKTIGNEAFYSCKSLEEVTIPSTVTSIGSNAFAGTALKTVTIPNGVKTIGTSAFKDCKNLESVTIPSSVTSIGATAFYNSGVKIICLPDSITSIGRNALKGIEKIVVNKDSKTAQTLEKLGTYSDQIYYNQAPEITCSNVEVTKGTAFDPLSGVSASDDVDGDLTGKIQVVENNYKDQAGKYTIVYEVEDSNGVKTTKKRTVTVNMEYPTGFSLYSKSKTLDQGAQTEITTNGFDAYCKNKNVTWSSSNNKVATVDSYGHVVAVSAGQVTITATSVGKNEDMESPASASITFTVYGLDEESGFKYSVNDNGITLEKYNGTDTEVTIPSTIDGKTVTNLGKYSFAFGSNAKNITKVTIPDTVVSISDYAFNGCKNLESVTIPNSVQSIGKRAFYGTALKSVTIPNGVKTIGQEAFYNCKSLEEVTIPSSVTSIGANAFKDTAIKTISLPDSITSIGTRALTSVEKIVVNKGTTTAQTLEKLGIYSDKIYYNEAPEITCENVEIKKGTAFDALTDVSASDDLDGDLSAKIQVVESNYKDEAGTYTIVYEVEDSNGLKTTKERTVTVTEDAKKESSTSKDDKSSKTNSSTKQDTKTGTSTSKEDKSSKTSSSVNTAVKQNVTGFSLTMLVASIGYLFVRKNKNLK